MYLEHHPGSNGNGSDEWYTIPALGYSEGLRFLRGLRSVLLPERRRRGVDGETLTRVVAAGGSSPKMGGVPRELHGVPLSRSRKACNKDTAELEIEVRRRQRRHAAIHPEAFRFPLRCDRISQEGISPAPDFCHDGHRERAGVRLPRRVFCWKWGGTYPRPLVRWEQAFPEVTPFVHLPLSLMHRFMPPTPGTAHQRSETTIQPRGNGIGRKSTDT